MIHSVDLRDSVVDDGSSTVVVNSCRIRGMWGRLRYVIFISY